MTDLHPELERILISEEEIQRRVAEIASEIDRDYDQKEGVVIVGILKGAFIFSADLSRKISIPHSIDFMSISS